MFWCSDVLMFWCSDVLMFRFSDVSVLWRSDLPVFQSSNFVIFKYFDFRIVRSSDLLYDGIPYVSNAIYISLYGLIRPCTTYMAFSLWNLFTVPDVTPTRTSLIIYLRHPHICTCLIRVIAIIPINFWFPPTNFCGAIIAWWDHTYHTYLFIPKLFYHDVYWAWICSPNHSHDLFS